MLVYSIVDNNYNIFDTIPTTFIVANSIN